MAATIVESGYYLAKYNDLSVAEPIENWETEYESAVWYSLKDELMAGYKWTVEKTEDSFDTAKDNNTIYVRTGFSDVIEMNGKRFVGGPGQELLKTHDRGVGAAAHILVKAETADGTILVMKSNADVTERGTGTEGKKVADFNAKFTNAEGDPVYIPGKASTEGV